MKMTVYVAKMIWGALCVAVLVVASYNFEPNTDKGDMVMVVMLTVMALLTFPSGIAVWFCFMGILMLLSALAGGALGCCAETSMIPAVWAWALLLFSWLIVFAAGYYQWFWLFPLLTSRGGRSNKRRPSGGGAARGINE